MSGHEFLSEQWLATLPERFASVELRPGATGTIRVQVSGGPSGKSEHVITLADGQITDASATADEISMTLKANHELLASIYRGEPTLAVAFMRGDIKHEGDQRLMLEFAALASTPDFAAAMASVAPAA